MHNSTPPTPPSGEPTDDGVNTNKRCFAETLAEIGWTPKYLALDPIIPSAVVPVGVAGHNDRYFVGPNYLHPEKGCMIQDHARNVYLIVRDVPTPGEAAQLLAKHGIPIEAA